MGSDGTGREAKLGFLGEGVRVASIQSIQSITRRTDGRTDGWTDRGWARARVSQRDERAGGRAGG